MQQEELDKIVALRDGLKGYVRELTQTIEHNRQFLAGQQRDLLAQQGALAGYEKVLETLGYKDKPPLKVVQPEKADEKPVVAGENAPGDADGP